MTSLEPPQFVTNDGARYVVKQFYRLEENVRQDDHPSIVETAPLIRQELERMRFGQYFLKHFYRIAESSGAEVYQCESFYCTLERIPGLTVTFHPLDLEFADTFVGQEVDGPSRVSMSITHHPDENWELDNEGWELDSESDKDGKGICWLVEQEQPKTVIKFGGTLQFSLDSGSQISVTINAFIHFTYVYSREMLVFADLQGERWLCPCFGRELIVSCAGTRHVTSSGHDGIILFDPMTHTITG